MSPVDRGNTRQWFILMNPFVEQTHQVKNDASVNVVAGVLGDGYDYGC